jgi:hypothetical protein
LKLGNVEDGVKNLDGRIEGIASKMAQVHIDILAGQQEKAIAPNLAGQKKIVSQNLEC